uniref:DNA2/NAM7 helicase-like C-terminal domain-containing protein n=1 Tax=Megaselia scalaris TaxID=36166 RepID=T1GMD1_MEGSC
MNPEIFSWINNYFYGNKFKSVLNNDHCNNLVKSYVIFNVNDSYESKLAPGNYSNSKEADFIFGLLSKLFELMPYEMYSYGIVTPYLKQKSDLMNKIQTPNILDLIDSLQGKEKDIIYIQMLELVDL